MPVNAAHGAIVRSIVDLGHDLSFRVVAVDQRGHGLSDKPASGYSGADFSADIASLVQVLDAGPAVIVGHSLGARNAFVVAASRPDLVCGVVAIDFTPFLASEIFDGIASRVGGGARAFDSPEAVAAYLRQRYPRFPEDAIQRRVANGYVEVDGQYAALADPESMVQTTNGLREDFEWAVRQVECQVLMIRGLESALVSPEAFEQTLAVRPDFSRLVIPDADHYIPEEVPSTVSVAIRRFAGSLV